MAVWENLFARISEFWGKKITLRDDIASAYFRSWATTVAWMQPRSRWKTSSMPSHSRLACIAVCSLLTCFGKVYLSLCFHIFLRLTISRNTAIASSRVFIFKAILIHFKVLLHVDCKDKLLSWKRKENGRKVSEKVRISKPLHTAISSTQQVSRHDEGSIRHLFIVAYRPLIVNRRIV